MPNLPSRIRTVTQRTRKERREIDRTDRKETSARASLERTETTPHSRTRVNSLGTEERESDAGGGERVQRALPLVSPFLLSFCSWIKPFCFCGVEAFLRSRRR